MKISIIYLTMLFNLICTFEAYSQEDENNYNITIESGIHSKYVWRGLTYNTGIVIQPALTAGYHNFNVQLWGNYTASDVNDDIKRHEIDLIFLYDFFIEYLTITPSFNYYSYPGQEDSPPTIELGLGLAYSLDDFNFAFTLSEDIKEVAGAIAVQLEAEYNFPVTDEFSAGLTAGIGWSNKVFNEYYVGTNKNALSFFSLQGTIQYLVLDNFTISPFIQNFIIIDKEIKELLYDNVFNYGLTLSLEL